MARKSASSLVDCRTQGGVGSIRTSALRTVLNAEGGESRGVYMGGGNVG